MAIQRKLRRGTKAENDAFTGAIGELVQDTDNDRIIIHDGSKSGGFPVPNYLDLQDRYFTTGDAVQDTAGDYVLTLPYAPIAYVEGQVFTIIPDSNNLGACDININGLGFKDIQKFDADGVLEELETDDLKAGVPYNIYYNGVRFALIQNGGGGGSKPIASVTISSASEVNFNIFQSGKNYRFEFVNILPATNGAEFQMQWSDDNGSTYIAGSNNEYAIYGLDEAGAEYRTNSGGTSTIVIGLNLGNLSTHGLDATLKMQNPNDSSVPAKAYWNGCLVTSSASNMVGFSGAGGHIAVAAINAIRFYMSTGNIASGKIVVFEEDTQ